MQDKAKKVISQALLNGGILFTTYTTASRNDRQESILEWLTNDGTNPQGSGCLLILDEGHKAKTKGTKTSLMVCSLQEQLRDLRVVYSTATAASEPRHMQYMPRLGFWGKGTLFATAEVFTNTLEHS